MTLGLGGNALHLGDAVIRILGDASEFNQQLSGIQATMAGTFQGITKLGGTITKTVTLPIVGIGVASVATASNFDQAMRNVNSIAQLSEEQFASFKEEIIDFSFTTRATATDLANAFYDVVSAGLSAAEGMMVVKAASRAAGAGLASAKDVAYLVIQAMRAYGYEASDATKITN
ncbi:phage tail tape measure protein, partial [Patescibacteria group bacterium]|nr:phage tail tape measure protein [Patescibacteria group bacterium]